MLLFVADNASYLTEDALQGAPLRARAAWGQEPYLCILVLTQGLKHNKCWTLSFPPVLCGFVLRDRLSPEVVCILSPAPSLPFLLPPCPLFTYSSDIPSSDSHPSASSAGEISLFWTSIATCLQFTSHRYDAFFSVILLCDPFLCQL